MRATHSFWSVLAALSEILVWKLPVDAAARRVHAVWGHRAPAGFDQPAFLAQTEHQPAAVTVFPAKMLHPARESPALL